MSGRVPGKILTLSNFRETPARALEGYPEVTPAEIAVNIRFFLEKFEKMPQGTFEYFPDDLPE